MKCKVSPFQIGKNFTTLVIKERGGVEMSDGFAYHIQHHILEMGRAMFATWMIESLLVTTVRAWGELTK